MIRDDNVYVKEVSSNGKITYRPFGRRYDERYMPDGIYYCHHSPGCSSTTNVDRYLTGLFKIGEEKIPDLPQLCGLNTYLDYLFHDESFRKIMDNNCYTWTELISAILSAIFRLNKEIVKRAKHEEE